jgi:hypothetical protein
VYDDSRNNGLGESYSDWRRSLNVEACIGATLFGGGGFNSPVGGHIRYWPNISNGYRAAFLKSVSEGPGRALVVADKDEWEGIRRDTESRTGNACRYYPNGSYAVLWTR